MKMNYQSGDRLKNRYLSNDAFTSLKNKLGGRSITSLGNNRRRNSYKIAGQGFDMLEYKTLIYRLFISVLLMIVIAYIIPQTRYFIHGFASSKFTNQSLENIKQDDGLTYDVAPNFFSTDYFGAKQKENYVENGLLVYDFITNNIIGLTENNSSSTINIRLFSDPGFKSDLLIASQDSEVVDQVEQGSIDNSTTSTSTVTVKEANILYKSYVFEGMGYGQMIAKIPPRTEVKKDSYVYIRTLDGLKPIAKIININEDNQSTFTVVYAQLIVSPQNIYKVKIK